MKGGPRKAQIATTLHAQTTGPLAWIALTQAAPSPMSPKPANAASGHELLSRIFSRPVSQPVSFSLPRFGKNKPTQIGAWLIQ